MLPRAHRLRRSAEFADVVRRGDRAGGQLVVLHRLRRSDREPSRVGFVVSRAVGDAVTRNAVKRRLRAVVAGRIAAWPSNDSLVIRALPAAAVAPSAALGSSIDRGLLRLDRRSAAEPRP